MRTDAFARIFPAKAGRFVLESLVSDLTSTVWQEEVEQLSGSIKDLMVRLGECAHFGENWSLVGKRAGELNDNLRDIALFFDNNDHTYVHWYEKRERAVIISATPIDVAAELRQNLYNKIGACVLTSATLSSGESFSYIKERLGLDESTEVVQFSSPFDYRNRTILYIPEESFPNQPPRVSTTLSVNVFWRYCG